MNNCEENYKGMCCCNCLNQVKIMKHPSNKLGQGSILDQMGYGCKGLGNEDGTGSIIFMDRPHGMCELWTPKPQQVSEAILNYKP